MGVVAVYGLEFVNWRYFTFCFRVFVRCTSESEVSRAYAIFHGCIRLSTSSRTDSRVRSDRTAGLRHNVVAILADNSIYSSLVSPSQ
jgi:hypothetical protein